MSEAKFGVAITASDKTQAGLKSAERSLRGLTKKAEKSSVAAGSVTQRGFAQWGRSLVQTFSKVEQASVRAFSVGGSGGGSGIIGRLGAIRQMAGLAGEGMAGAATEAGALEAGIVGIGGAAVATGAVVVGLAAGMTKLADSWGKGANQLGNMASLIGVSTEGLQKFAGAAERVGVDKNTAMGAMGGLSQSLNDARYGRNTTALAVLGRLGVGMKLKADGDVDVEAMLPAISNALKRQTSSGRRTAGRALGIADGAMPAFTQGADKLTADMADYGRNGAVVSDKDTELGRALTHRDTVAAQWLEKGVLAGNRANAGIVKGAGDYAIAGYEAVTKRLSGSDETSAAPTQAGGGSGPASPGRSGLHGRSLSLSAQDVIDLKKTVQTEWNPRYEGQGRGIVDTILNRQASGHWGSTIADVVNARSQFSDINGPVAWKRGRHSVGEFPMSRVTRRVSEFVDQYLAQRADGAGSAVGSNLNYANPFASDRRNLQWINRLDGPVLGGGQSVHRHGTTPELEKYRPEPFKVEVTVLDQRVKARVTSKGGGVSHAFGDMAR